ncbi:putative C-type lectin protein [Seiridium cardinale]|uniref:C-type lectin protein n=1 Tax=Seiridium cardinale TaxID=138064 RepID=A0ABR2Y9H7_9PEZI
MSVNLIGGSRSSSANFGSEPLLALPGGGIFDLAHGYVPLLGNFTNENKAAKGLRKRNPNEVHLASGRRTSFAKHLGYRLNTDNLESWPLVRNEFGELCEESWAVTTNSLQDNLARVGKLIVA